MRYLQSIVARRRILSGLFSTISYGPLYYRYMNIDPIEIGTDIYFGGYNDDNGTFSVFKITKDHAILESKYFDNMSNSNWDIINANGDIKLIDQNSIMNLDSNLDGVKWTRLNPSNDVIINVAGYDSGNDSIFVMGQFDDFGTGRFLIMEIDKDTHSITRSFQSDDVTRPILRDMIIENDNIAGCGYMQVSGDSYNRMAITYCTNKNDFSTSCHHKRFRFESLGDRRGKLEALVDDGTSNKDYYAIDYAHGVTCIDEAYANSVYSPNQDRIYLMPWNQSTQSTWHYIDCTDGSVHAYVHGAGSLSNDAYLGGVYSPNQDRIYLVPYYQSNQSSWHYIDCTDGSVHAYVHGATCVAPGYAGGVYSPNQDRIYLVPWAQSTQSTWHYIDCTDGSVHAYVHGATCVAPGYTGGVYSTSLDRIYLIPFKQSNQSTWHYIDCATGNIVPYAHGQTLSAYAYAYGVYHNDNVIFSPVVQASEVEWHYIDGSGNVVPYIHGQTTTSSYFGGSVSPNQDRIYFTPLGQSDESTWDYLSLVDGNYWAFGHFDGDTFDYIPKGAILKVNPFENYNPTKSYVMECSETYKNLYLNDVVFYNNNCYIVGARSSDSDFTTFSAGIIIKCNIATDPWTIEKVMEVRGTSNNIVNYYKVILDHENKLLIYGSTGVDADPGHKNVIYKTDLDLSDKEYSSPDGFTSIDNTSSYSLSDSYLVTTYTGDYTQEVQSHTTSDITGSIVSGTPAGNIVNYSF